MDAYVATFFEGEVRFATCVESSWFEQKARPNTQHRVLRLFYAYINQDMIWMDINHYLMDPRGPEADITLT